MKFKFKNLFFVICFITIVPLWLNSCKEKIEILEGNTVEDLQEIEALREYKICWAQIKWTDRHTCGESCDTLLDNWLWKECDGDDCPWDPKIVYGHTCPGSSVGFCKVKVGNIQDCTTDMKKPSSD